MKNYILFLFLILLIAACGDDEPVVPTCPSGEENTHILLGNPSEAENNINKPENYLIQLPEYALSYNRDRGIPNWVSWHVTNNWLDVADRQDDFRGYSDLPDGWYEVVKSSYTNSGFDRGHNCPSGDRTCSEMGNSSTFYMINITPQAPNHNRGVWSSMESFSRDLVLAGKEIYVIMGSYGNGGEDSNGTEDFINNGNIAVPESIWKVLLILDDGGNDLLRIVDNTRVIAVNIPNKNDVSTGMDWHDYMTNVDDIEAKTGYDLFSELPFSLQNTLEQKVDQGPW